MTGHAPLPRHVDPHDVLAIDSLLSDDERLLRDTVRQLVRDKVLPEVGDWFDRGVFPREMAKEFGSLGLLGMHLEGYGCAGTSATAYGLACLELEAGDSGARSFVSVQGSLAMFPIWAFGSEEQKQRWLPGMAAGDLVGCLADRARLRIGPVVDAHHRPAGARWGLGARRHEDVDHQRVDRGRGGRVGPHRPRRSDGCGARLRRPDRHARVLRRRSTGRCRCGPR